MNNHDFKPETPLPNDKLVIIIMLSVVALSYIMQYIIDNYS